MAADILARNGVIAAVGRPLDGEVPCHKGGEIKSRLLSLLVIALDDGRRCILRNRIDEGLAVGEDALHLHVLEQLTVKLRRGLSLPGRLRGDAMRGDANRKNDADDSDLHDWLLPGSEQSFEIRDLTGWAKTGPRLAQLANCQAASTRYCLTP